MQDYFELGYIKQTHGINGFLKAILDVDYPENYTKLESIFLFIEGRLIPFFIEEMDIQDKVALLKFEDINDIHEASKLKGVSLFAPIHWLPKLPEDQYYYHEIIGFEVIDSRHGALGQVKELFTHSPQVLFSVLFQQKEVLIPLQDDIVTKVDKQTQKIFVTLPEGLLEIYLED